MVHVMPRKNGKVLVLKFTKKKKKKPHLGLILNCFLTKCLLKLYSHPGFVLMPLYLFACK